MNVPPLADRRDAVPLLCTLVLLLVAVSSLGAVAQDAVEPTEPTVETEPDDLFELPEPGESPESPFEPLELLPEDPFSEEPRERVKPFEHAREVLRASGVTDSQLWFLREDGQSLSSEARETVQRIMAQLDRIRDVHWILWSRSGDQLPRDRGEPNTARLNIYALRGVARQVDVVPIRRDLAERLELSKFYRVRVRLTGDTASAGREVVVFSREIPAAWKLGSQLNDPVSFRGLLLRTGLDSAETPWAWLATRRLEWHPQQPRPEAGITPDLARLGRLGIDIDSLRQVRDRRVRLQIEDRLPFYQLLELAGRMPPEQFAADARSGPEVFATLLTEPDSLRGALVRFRGRARRAVRVAITDEAIRAASGMDHYYDVVVFVDIPVRVQLAERPSSEDESATDSGDKAEADQKPDQPKSVDYASYPVSVCLRELPPGMPEGWEIDQEVRVAGHFLRLYGYSSEYLRQLDPDKSIHQVSPMLVGRSCELVDSGSASPLGPWVTASIPILFIFAALGVILGVWQFSRSTEEFQREVIGKRVFSAKPEDLQALADLPVEDRFAGLRDRDPEPRPDP